MNELPEKCVPCRGGARALTLEQAQERMGHVAGWSLDYPRISRRFELPDFRAALAWINRVGMLAEEEQHHPDLHITSWNRVEIVLWTHDVDGLHDNDFVLARKIDRLWEH